MLNKSYAYTVKDNESKAIVGYVTVRDSLLARSLKPILHTGYNVLIPEMMNSRIGQHCLAFQWATGVVKGYKGKLISIILLIRFYQPRYCKKPKGICRMKAKDST